jgi:predicted transcriptional regulator
VPGRVPIAARPQSGGLADLRRRGTVTELLLLYECTTQEPLQLRPIAERLGVTVQAVSHSFRTLSARGLVEVRAGRYRPTVAGVAWLHAALGGLREDLSGRLDRLNVVGSTRAVALDDLVAGAPVSLELRDGILGARRGTAGPSRGVVRTTARTGELVEVDRLSGIVPIARGTVQVLTLPARRVLDPGVAGRLARALRKSAPSLLAAQGLEAFHLVRSLVDRPVVRFAVAAAVQEASRVGVGSTVVVADEELPRFLEQFTGPDPAPLEVRPIAPGASPGRARAPRGPRAGSRPRRRAAPTPASRVRP